MTIGLVMMFLICAALLLWIIIGARGWWLCKLPVIAGTLYFAAVVWYSVDSYLGWPSQHHPPRKFQLHWAMVDEPMKGEEEQGGIYLWLTKMRHEDDQKAVKSWEPYVSWLGYEQVKSPRVYRVPYNRELHKQMAKAQSMLKKGQKVIGEFAPGKQGKFGDGKGKGKGKGGDGDGKGGKEGEGKPGGQGYRGDNRGLGDWKFYRFPPPKLPEKK